MNKLKVLLQANRWFHFQRFCAVPADFYLKTFTTEAAVRVPEQQHHNSIGTFLVDQRKFSIASNEPSDTSSQESPLDNVAYERVCAETLDSLCDLFEELLEKASNLSGSDVSYSDGVLTIKLGKEYGTYVINRQTPNKQIWLSSPTSGPKRYDFVGPKSAETGRWIYKHNNESMHELLQREIKLILKDLEFDFFALPYGS